MRPPRAVVAFSAEIGLGLVAAAAALAQAPPNNETSATQPGEISPASYRERMTQADMSLEWYTYLRLSTFVHAENSEPGLGVDLVAQEYGLGIAEATALLQAVRDVAEKSESSTPGISICAAGIASDQAYIDWWASYEGALRSHRHGAVQALIRAVGASIWEVSFERAYLPWLRGEGLGDRINFRKQIEVAPYSVWMRGWCQR